MSFAAELAVLITVLESIIPLLHQLVGDGFKGITLDDLSSCDQQLPKAGKAPGITMKSTIGDRGGTFIRRVSGIIESFLAIADPISNPLGAHDKLPGCFVRSFIVVK
jgi:hypothetical protein